MKKPTKQDLLDLATDVKKAAWLEFYKGHNDRRPDGTRLTSHGQQWIADALTLYAEHLEEVKG